VRRTLERRWSEWADEVVMAAVALRDAAPGRQAKAWRELLELLGVAARPRRRRRVKEAFA